jgi:hypothetical protein
MITRIGASVAAATTITIPAGHQVGDFIVIYAFRNALVAPTLPAGWTNQTSESTGASSFRLAWKQATSSSETSGTWTNASQLAVVVYRGMDPRADPTAPTRPFSTNGAVTGTSNSVTLNAIQPTQPSVLLIFAADKFGSNGLNAPPTGFSSIAYNSNFISNTEVAAFEGTANPFQGDFAASSIALLSSAEWRSIGLELHYQGPNRWSQPLRPRPFTPGIAR